uniref:Uncharacterized protein n=1 Tax=Aegilops tauschii subsp. strangulata TaxID=200361 RepID=A0A453ARW4_AEGTS
MVVLKYPSLKSDGFEQLTLPVLVRLVDSLRGLGCEGGGAPRLGRGLRLLPLPPDAHVRGFEVLRLLLPCLARAWRPAAVRPVRGLRGCSCTWIPSRIQTARLGSNHAGLSCRFVQSTPHCGAWTHGRCSFHPASFCWFSGSSDVACGGIVISGRNGWISNRGCGDICYPRDILLCYHSSSSTSCLEVGPGGQESTVAVLLRYLFPFALKYTWNHLF